MRRAFLRRIPGTEPRKIPEVIRLPELIEVASFIFYRKCEVSFLFLYNSNILQIIVLILQCQLL